MAKRKQVDSVTEVVPINLETALASVSNCVYMVHNEVSKRCLIGSSTNVYTTIGRLLEDLRLGNGEYSLLKEELEFVSIQVLETNIDKRALRLRCSYWISVYKEKGYKMYKDVAPIRYTLSIDLGYRDRTLHYFVSLRNNRNDYRLIAIFSTKKEMNEWIRVHYPDKERIGAVVVHESSLEGYRQSKGST